MDSCVHRLILTGRRQENVSNYWMTSSKWWDTGK